MLTLIKREIHDHMVFFLIAIIIAMISVSVTIYIMTNEDTCRQQFGMPSIMYKVLIFSPLTLLPFASAALGASQMQRDKDKKISNFLVTLATTRRRILSAKIISGFLWILMIFLPIALVDMILLRLFPKLVLIDLGFFTNIFVAMLLCNIACYAFGLQIGENAKKVIPAFGVIAVTPILMSIVIIKGFGFQVIAILLLFTIAAMVRTWQKFMSTSI